MSLYFDHAASTPPFPEALERFKEIHLAHFANPSSSHRLGKEAQQTYHQLKESFCQQLSFEDGLLLQTSSATESNNMVIHSFLKQHPHGRIILGIDVHASMWYIQQQIPEQCEILNIDSEGQYKFQEIDLGNTQATLILINYISQDLGTLHNTDPWHGLCNKEHCHLHIDATQAFGKVNLSCDQLAFHSMSASAHKFGGTRGCGLFLIKNKTLSPMIHGGSQEDQLRAGSESLASMAAAEYAYRLSLEAFNHDHMTRLDSHLVKSLENLPQEIIYNCPKHKCPGLNNFSFPNYLGSEMVAALSLQNIYTATGSACSESKTQASRAVLAFGRNDSEGLGSLRISLGHDHKTQDIDLFVDKLKGVLTNLGHN